MATPVPSAGIASRIRRIRTCGSACSATTRDPHEIMRRFADDYARRPDYVEAYRSRFGFHPVHAIFAVYPLKRLGHVGRVIVAAPRDPTVPRHLGFEVAGSVEEAVALAEKAHGAGASIALREAAPRRHRADDLRRSGWPLSVPLDGFAAGGARGDRARGRAARLRRRVVARGGRRRLLRAARGRRRGDVDALGHGDRQRVHARPGDPGDVARPASPRSAPGRFCLGIGAGSQPIVESWNGGVFSRPATRVRETAKCSAPRARRRARRVPGRDLLGGRLPAERDRRAARSRSTSRRYGPGCCASPARWATA